MVITRSRRVQTNDVVLDQVDIFQGNGYARVASLTISDVGAKLFWNNQLQPWAFVDGTSIPDTLVVSGYVFWNEIPGAPGFYNVRFRPQGTGYWRLVVTYLAGLQTTCVDYDVLPESATLSETGLRASFIKP